MSLRDPHQPERQRRWYSNLTPERRESYLAARRARKKLNYKSRRAHLVSDDELDRRAAEWLSEHAR